jgi:hypothetical protein
VSEWSTAHDIQHKILQYFKGVASNWLLFTKLEELRSVRIADSTKMVSWSTQAEPIHELVEDESGFSAR